MIKNTAALAAGLTALAAAACHRPLQESSDFQGILELDERVLSFEQPGRVQAVAVRRGDVVKDGQLVAKLDDTLERLTRKARADEASAARADLALLEAGARAEDVASLAAEVVAATSAEDLAKKTYERVKALRDSGSVSAADLDRAKAELDRAAAQRASIAQRLASLRKGSRPEEIARAHARSEAAGSALALEDAKLARFELRAESDGLVVDVHVKSGEVAGVGTPAATVVDAAHPYVDVFVPEGRLAGIRLGTKGEVRVDGAAAPAPCEVEYVSPRTEFTPRFLFSERERPHVVIRVRVRVDDPRRELHAGVTAFVRFAR
jgi:HlyD family secretion protein